MPYRLQLWSETQSELSPKRNPPRPASRQRPSPRHRRLPPKKPQLLQLGPQVPRRQSHQPLQHRSPSLRLHRREIPQLPSQQLWRRFAAARAVATTASLAQVGSIVVPINSIEAPGAQWAAPVTLQQHRPASRTTELCSCSANAERGLGRIVAENARAVVAEATQVTVAQMPAVCAVRTRPTSFHDSGRTRLGSQAYPVGAMWCSTPTLC